MTPFGRKTARPYDERLQRRVSQIATEDLMAWVESALYGIHRNLADYRRGSDATSLSDARENAQALVAVLAECERRYNLP